jgi:ribosomal protein S6--L-glutamate ligase
LQLMARDGLKLPVTTFAHDARVSKQVVEAAGGAPLLIKLLEDTQGVRTVLADTDRSAQSVIEAFRRAKVNILVQQVINEPEATGIRVLVLGNEVIAATTRSIDEESGIEPSGMHEPEAIDIKPDEAAAAIQAARTVGLNLAGVDLVRSASGPLVQEVTSSPGLEDIETTTGIDAASRIIGFLEEHAGKSAIETQGQG